jgi:hypothetical protein
MQPRLFQTLAWALAVPLLLASAVAADEILFLNGDRLTGKIVKAEGGAPAMSPSTSPR